jgi:uncharacterized protein (TIGR02246 family)
VNNNPGKDKKPERVFTANPLQDAEDAASKVGPSNPALGDIYQRLYPEMQRPKPNQEAIAAALQAMQRLTMKMDSETAVEQTSPQSVTALSIACPACGHSNREGNRFCAACGARVDPTENVSASGNLAGIRPSEVDPDTAKSFTEQSQFPALSESKSSPLDQGAGQDGTHHYHHHYHHHYFPAGAEAGPAKSRSLAPETGREADRLRIAAAAKGEPITRSEAAVRRLTQEWVLACNTRQLDELVDLYAPDALVLRSNLPLLRGAAQVREFFFSALQSGLGEVALEPIRVEVSGDVAHEVGRYSALVPGTTGKRREERGKYMWVFAKQANQDWKLVSECWSSDLTLTNAESDLPKAINTSASKTTSKKA